MYRKFTRVSLFTALLAVHLLVSGAVSECGAQKDTLRLTAQTRTFSPGDPIDIAYTLELPASSLISDPAWVGLMKASESHRAIPYYPLADIRVYQPKPIDQTTSGTFTYTAPEIGGEYEVRMFDQKRGVELATVSFRVEDRFVEELKAWQKELKDARAVLNSRYDKSTVKGTYLSAFQTAGVADYDQRASAWSDSFLVRFIANDATTAAFTFYHDPLEKVTSSIFQITGLMRRHSKEDVQHYREGMRRWRETHTKLYPKFERWIAIEAEANRDLQQTAARMRSLTGKARDTEQAAAKKRGADRQARKDKVYQEIFVLKERPIFSYVATRAPGAR